MLQFSLSLNLYSFLYHSTVAIFSELYKLVLIMLSLDKDNQHKTTRPFWIYEGIN